MKNYLNQLSYVKTFAGILKFSFLLLLFSFCDRRTPVSVNKVDNIKENLVSANNQRRTSELGNAKILYTQYDKSSDKYFLYRINIDGSDKILLNPENQGEMQWLPGFGECISPVWSPDGKKIVYLESWGIDDLHLVLMDEYGNDKKILTQGTNARWSPKGNRLVYGSGAWNKEGIVDTSGNWFDLYCFYEEHVFYCDTVSIEYSDFSWAPDGEHLYVNGEIKKEPPEHDLFLLNVESGELVERITYLDFNFRNFEISPDGEKVATFEGSYPENYIGFMVLDIGVLNQITNTQISCFKWSNDGKYLIYLKKIDEVNHKNFIYLIDPNEPFNEIKLFDFYVYSSPPDIYFEDINSGIWDDY